MTPDPIPRESLLSPSSTTALIEASLDRFLPSAETAPAPLHRAMRYAVFSGGRRLRPQLLLQVAQACGAQQPELGLALRAACALELIHIASLVHDDLPCFDDAAVRRGRPTVHVLFGESMAVLVGDALLTHSFELVADTPRALAPRALRLIRLLVRATGSSAGIIGGQSLEPEVSRTGAEAWGSPEFIERYHGMKTGVLFRMAAEAAAVAAGSPKTGAWAGVGQLFGKWYQLAYDLTALRQRATPPLPRAEVALRAQLQEGLAELHTRVLAVAVDPAPLLAFLDALRDHLLHATGTPAAEGAARAVEGGK